MQQDQRVSLMLVGAKLPPSGRSSLLGVVFAHTKTRLLVYFYDGRHGLNPRHYPHRRCLAPYLPGESFPVFAPPRGHSALTVFNVSRKH